VNERRNTNPPGWEVGARSARGGGRRESSYPDSSACVNASTLPTMRQGELNAILVWAAAILRSSGVESPRREARLLLAQALSVSQEAIVAGQARTGDAGLACFAAFVARRAAREPLAYIIGSREFWSLDFKVGPGVLIPRPESETLLEVALRHFPDSHAAPDMLDLGTGSGCLLLAFLRERVNAHGVGVDASPSALSWAKRNAAALGLESRARFIGADWREAGGAYDGIFANPPYIRADEVAGLAPEVAKYEPHIALSGGLDGLDAYRALGPILRARLKPQGLAFVELGEGQAESVATILTVAGLTVHEAIADLSGISRCLITGPADGGRKKQL
jgi:release factor glutamine methyltransferase